MQDISEEKGASKTTKQTVTLTTVAVQKVQDKTWMEHTGYKEESSEKALCAYIIMTIIQGIQQRPLHHDYKQTKTLPVIMINSFQTSVTDVRCWKWFTETSQIITVTSQTHSRPYHYYTDYSVLQQY